MKTQEELKKLDAKKLNEELSELKNHLIKLQFDIRSGQAKNTHMLKVTRKQIARIQTLMRAHSAQNQTTEDKVRGRS
ncbi:50S ribosomal protein L29 [Candidatus Peregrinibacteria bacterium]|nr:50S ribosomal protein L29 [Candidatus Peregrinibacteria bacterium]